MTQVEQMTQFEEDGFVVLENIFDQAAIERISGEVDRILEGRHPAFPTDELIYEPGSDPPRVRNAFRLHLYDEFFLSVARHPPLIAAVAGLLGAPLRLYGSQLFAKPARVGTEVPLHQDMPYWPFEPYEMLSAWIALDDSTVENGCVRYLAGSHRLGMLPHAPSGVSGNSLGLVAGPRVSALPEVAVEVRRGSCVLHHCLTVHRSQPNSSPQSRRGLIFVYMSPNVRLTDPGRLKCAPDFPEVR
jgi:ectoine hydroxylase-related dioxygenase (phytanoyl-CoA dioxygenase family)